MDGAVASIRTRLRALAERSRADFRAYVEEARLEPLLGAFFEQEGVTRGAALRPAAAARIAGDTFARLRHSFDMDIREGRRARLMRLEYGDSDRRGHRDAYAAPLPSGAAVPGGHRDLLQRALDEVEGGVYDPRPCGP